ncbi:hypothetical protein D3C84_940860 [compost metagenome]
MAEASANSPPLNLSRVLSRIGEKPPLFMVCQRCSSIGAKVSGLFFRRCSSSVKPRSGSRPTSSANMVNRARIRKLETSCGE